MKIKINFNSSFVQIIVIGNKLFLILIHTTLFIRLTMQDSIFFSLEFSENFCITIDNVQNFAIRTTIFKMKIIFLIPYQPRDLLW